MTIRAALLVTTLALAACGSGGPSAETVAAERAAVAADAAQRAQAQQQEMVSSAASPPANAAAGQNTPRPAGARALDCPSTGEGPYGQRYRARLNPPGGARIVSRRSFPDIRQGSCNIEVAYPGAETAAVISYLGTCEEAPPRVYEVEQLRELGQLDDLSPSVRADIERLENIGVVGVEGDNSWVVFVPDAQCSVADVFLAD